MAAAKESGPNLLLIDTCGEAAGVALSAGDKIVSAKMLEQGRASAEIVGAVRRLLAGAGWSLADLSAVGVVSGPGSFTGVRTGLAAAKGLAEAAGLRLVPVSRLEVLATSAHAAGGFVVLDAGRGEVFLRDVVTGSESLCDADALPEGDLMVAEVKLADRLAGRGPRLHTLSVSDALATVMEQLGRSAPGEGVLAEANYVRGEDDIYAKRG